MKTSSKVLLSIAGLATAGLLIAASKAKDVVETGAQLVFRFRTISNIKFDTSTVNNIPKVMVTARLSIFVDNPTDVNFDVDGFGMATLKEVNILDALGNSIATASVDIPQLVIPARGTIKIDNIPIQADGLKALQNIQNIMNLTGIQITGKIQALGTTFTV